MNNTDMQVQDLEIDEYITVETLSEYTSYLEAHPVQVRREHVHIKARRIGDRTRFLTYDRYLNA